MAILNDNEFTGIPAQRFKIQEPIKAEDLRTIAQDQSHVYERLTGLDADGVGTASTNGIHSHGSSEPGNVIPRIIATWQWGTRGPSLDTHWNYPSYDTYAGPFRVQTTTSASKGEVTLCAFPFYVPPHLATSDIVLVIECNSNPRSSFMVYDSSDTEMLTSRVVLQDPNTLSSSDAANFVARMGLGDRAWAGMFQTGTSGLFYLVAALQIEDINETREFRSGTMMGVYNVKGSTITPPAAPVAGGNNVDVGDPTASNAWQPIDATLLPTADGPLHAAVGSMMIENNALLYEKATGLPAPGNTTLTVTRGHCHDGTSGEGEELDGQIITAVLCGSVVDSSYISGSHAKAPKIIATSGSTQIVGVNTVYMPRSAYTTSADSRVRFAVLVYNDNAGGTNYMSIGATFGLTSKSFNSAIKSGFELITTPTAGSNIFGFGSNASNLVVVEAAGVVGVTSNMRVCGYCFYVEV